MIMQSTVIVAALRLPQRLHQLHPRRPDGRQNAAEQAHPQYQAGSSVVLIPRLADTLAIPIAPLVQIAQLVHLKSGQ